MPAPRRPAPLERPDPVVLLMDAVINRQSDLAQRLAQQWIHRRGLAAFTDLTQVDLRRTCGDDGVTWLQQRLGLKESQTPAVAVADGSAPGQATAPTLAPVGSPTGHTLGHLIREAVAEALTPLRPSETAPAATVGGDPWPLPPLPQPTSNPGQTGAAPAPADLAGLRAWLHRDAA